MVRVRSRVRGVDKTLNEIKRDLHRGMQSSADTLVSNGKQHARQVITTNQAIFNAEVYRKFKDAETKNNTYHVRAKLYNNADHADVLESGAQYTAKGPPVKALLPWVSRKMSWRPDFGRDNDGRPNSLKGFSKGGGGSKNETLDVAGETRTYPDGWNTYDPLTVETVPNNDVYESQEVELLNIEEETFVSGIITHKHPVKDEYTVDVGDNEYFITTPGDSVSDPYKIIANEPFDNLDEADQIELVEGAVDGINAGPDLDSRRESIIKSNLKGEVVETFDDNQKAYNLFQRHDNIFAGEAIDGIGMHQSQQGGTYNVFLTEDAGRSTHLHEMMHGSHKYDGLNSKVYPSNDQDYFNNLFNADGTNALGETWDVSDVLLQDSTEEPLGLPDDGSIPEIVKLRTSAGDGYEYTDTFDQNDWLTPDTESFEIGDRLKMTTPLSSDAKAHELVDRGPLDADGMDSVPGEITKYEMLDLETDNRIEIWVDQDGDFYNMQGVRIEEVAESPTGETSIPDVELSSEDPMDRLTEATNIAYMEMVWSASELERGGDVNDDVINVVGRPYSMRAANETYTSVSEMMRANNPRGRFQDRSFLDVDSLSSLDDNYPYLIEAWLENFQPSDEVGDILGDWGYNV